MDWSNAVLAESTRKRVERGLVGLALGMFLLHLLLYGVNFIFELNWPDAYFSHPLQTLYTPFSAILVAEVYLLIHYLPTSFARAMGKQMEIIALIEIRSVFKDVDFNTRWPWEADFFPHLLGAVMVGSILVAFYRVLPRRIARIEELELQRFINFKKILAGFLFVYLLLLSGWSIGVWASDLYTGSNWALHDPNNFFYNDFFTALILVDVLLLVISFRYLSDFGLVFRNCGFIISTILLRRALVIEPWHAFAYEVTSATLALVVLLLHRGLASRNPEK
ncbi:MAG: hypothetical protein ACO2XQ_09715 [Flavobacteriales bacterium]